MGEEQPRLEDRPVTNIVESLPEHMRELFAEVIGAHDPVLLSRLTSHDEPTLSERLAVEDILATEFSTGLRGDWEPTDRGRRVDEILGAFLLKWPINAE
jgi:hypothetical protein